MSAAYTSATCLTGIYHIGGRLIHGPYGNVPYRRASHSLACISQACIPLIGVHPLKGVHLIYRRASHRYTPISEVPGSIRARSCSDAEIAAEVGSLIQPGYYEISARLPTQIDRGARIGRQNRNRTPEQEPE